MANGFVKRRGLYVRRKPVRGDGEIRQGKERALVWNALTADRNRSRSIDRGWPEVGDAALGKL